MSNERIDLRRDAAGGLVMTDAAGREHVGVLPVRAFALSAPDEGLAIISTEGRELAWIDHLDALVPATRALILEALAPRELTPTILRIRSVSSVVSPSTWEVATDLGETRFVLKAEEDIRQLADGSLLITSAQGLTLRIRDRQVLDRGSRKLLDRFL
ncbi:MAG TPA: DUF1854 domain-containing protein [Burkholderiaceae bacterium]|nr:DUF1854 domain-containing protein [Burkholderiaceae bacterium]